MWWTPDRYLKPFAHVKDATQRLVIIDKIMELMKENNCGHDGESDLHGLALLKVEILLGEWLKEHYPCKEKDTKKPKSQTRRPVSAPQKDAA